MPVIITILAWTGAFLSCLLTIPQAVRTLRCDRLDGLSVATYWIIFANATIWAIWAALTNEYAAGLPSLVNGPAALLILQRLHRSHRSVAHAAHTEVAPYEPDRPFPQQPGLLVGALSLAAGWAPY